MIGYYVHHHGSGHLHRAVELAGVLDDEVTGLSSLEAPAGWSGRWIRLPLDTDPASTEDVASQDRTAHGRLHWVPVGSTGLAERMSAISAWIASARPSCIVADVSVEVALLARLHGIPVVVIAQPGMRTDPAHTLVYDIAAAIVAPWPDGIDPLTSVADVAQRMHRVGAISRLPVAPPSHRRSDRVAILRGSGGRGPSALDGAIARLEELLPTAEMVEATGTPEQIAAILRGASVVIAHCGQNAIAEIAATRTPAVLVPEERPHDEQVEMARAIARSTFPALVLETAREAAGTASDDVADLVRRARTLDGADWSGWVDGGAAARAATVIRDVSTGVGARNAAGRQLAAEAGR